MSHNANTASAAGINKLHLFDNISQDLNKAKAIARLMAYAVAEGLTDHGEEIIWAHQVVDSLIDEAFESAEILADQKRESDRDAPSPDPA
jgi:hypothetical protein